MREEGRISALQLMFYQITAALATLILFTPALATSRARYDIWLSGILTCLFGFLIAVIAAKLALRFPQQTVIQYSPRLLGNFLGKAVGFIYIFFFLFVSYINQRQFGELMTTGYFPNTPLIVFIGILTLLACYLVYQGLEVICRVITLWSVFSVSFFLILALVAKDIEIARFQPFLEQGIGPVVAGMISPAALIGEVSIILMVLPFVSDKRRAVISSMAAVFVLFVFWEIVVVATVGAMGAETVSRLIFPFFTLYRRVELATLPVLERQDAVLMVLWVGGLLWKLGIFLHVGVLGLGQLFGLKSHRPLIFPMGALAAALSVQGWEGVPDLINSLRAHTRFIYFPEFVIPGLLLVIAVLRGKRDQAPTEGGGMRAPAPDKET